MRTFKTVRTHDVSGVSGTGVVTEGVEFTDGTVVLKWLTSTSSTAFYNSIEDVIAIHGHEGSTTIQWDDETPADIVDDTVIVNTEYSIHLNIHGEVPEDLADRIIDAFNEWESK